MLTWNNRPIQILVVEDDARLAEAITHYLHHCGYEVRTVGDGLAALVEVTESPPDLVVLDLMLPGLDGWEVVRRLRPVSRVPIIILTARTSEDDRVTGLQLGADDYVPKPFSMKELEARIQAVLRRAHMAPPTVDNVLYDDGHMRLEWNGMRVLRDGEPVALTLTERRVLFRLVRSANEPVSAEQLLHDVWGTDSAEQLLYVKLYIWRLRQKLEALPGKPDYIRTDRGFGYRFVPRSEQTGRPQKDRPQS